VDVHVIGNNGITPHLLAAQVDSHADAIDRQHPGISHHALYESERRLRALVTASSDAMYRMGADWSEMHQLKRHMEGREFLAETEEPSRNWLHDYIYPEDQPRILAAIGEAIRTKGIFELEHRVLQADGNLGWTLSRAVPLLNEAGEIRDWFGMASDITESKRATNASAKVSDSSGRSSNPPPTVSSVSIATGTLPISMENAKNLLAISGDLLGRHFWEAFPSTIYEGSPFVEFYNRAMNESLPGDFEAFYPEPFNSWYHVLARPSADGITIFFQDTTASQRASAALIQNEKLAAVGRLAASIAHEVNNPLESVTNLIYLARTTKGIGGTGLGLWISKEIITRHNGDLRLSSSQRPGHTGTVVTISLPCDAVSP